MKKLRWPLLVVLLALVAIGILLYSQYSQRQQIASNDSPGAISQVKPAQGGIYTEGLIGSFNRLNPVLDNRNQADRDIDRLIFSGLIRYDDRGLPQGDLAESWGISQDGKVYNFSIRQNAVWQDGQPVTADDVLFTVDLMRDENSTAPDDVKALWKEVEVAALDPKMIQFRLPEPYAPFLDYLSFGVLPKHLLDGKTFQDLVDDPFNLKPVGSGPYRLDRFAVTDGQVTGVVLAAFHDYYAQKPFIEQFVFRYFPDAQSAYEAYKKGEVMGISQVTPDLLPQVSKEPKLSIQTGQLPELSMIFLNLDNPDVSFFQEADIRRALLLGLNRQWMIDHLLDGQAIVANGPVFPNSWAYYDDTPHLDYDPDQAVALLKDKGYTIPAEGGSVRADKDGKKLSFELVYPEGDRYQALADEIQKDWAKIGVEVTLTALPYDQLISDDLDTRTYQAALVDLNLARTPDPDPYPFWHQTQTASGQNYSKWNDFQASEYLEQARTKADIGERTKQYKNFQVRFADQLPALPLFYPVYTYAIDSQVQGVRMGSLLDPSDRFATVTSWYLLSRTATGEELKTQAAPVTATPSP